MITVLYFARLRESLGRSNECLNVPARATVSALRSELVARGGNWAAELAEGRAVRVAVNQVMVAGDAPLRDGDEVAFFPPVTGG